MSNALREELFRLSAAERLELVEELWDSIADDDPALVLTDAQREDLDRRLAEADADPRSGSPWEEARERIRHRSRVTLPVRVRHRAELDIDEAYTWYEGRAEGLGESFLRAVDASLARIARDPEAYAVAHDRVRRARLHRFPYGVYYTIREDFIDVLAVYHGRRLPRRFDS